jgi:hypothetical protein
MTKFIVLLAFLVLIGVTSAAQDSDILQFSSGVLAGSDATAAIVGDSNDHLMLTYKLSEYSDGLVGTIAYELFSLANSAEKITKQFPGKFKQVDLKIFDSSGTKLVGLANIAVN